MKRISILSLICSLLLASVPARAIELSLEENRGERGSVGFVDMRRLFTASPDATHAREGLEELVRQAEERVNSKKADLLRLRQELGSLKIERDELAKSTPTVSAPLPAPKQAETPALAPVAAKPMAPTPAPKPVETPKPAVAKPVEVAAAVTAAPPAPVTAPAPSTAAATNTPPPLTINLPGLTDGPLNLERPGGSPLNPTRAKPEPVAATPAPVAAPVVVSTPVAPAPPAMIAPVVVVSTPVAPVPVVVVPAGPTLAQRLLEFDGRIVAKQGEIERVQNELDRERMGAERSLLDAEGRKTDQVLARLYRAISEVAKREGVSVVVDKSATLYGHPAVDLTDKILKQLRGVVPAQ